MYLLRFPGRGGESSAQESSLQFKYVDTKEKNVFAGPAVEAEFTFGEGPRTSCFLAHMRFSDIAFMLQVMKDNGHPEATELVGSYDLEKAWSRGFYSEKKAK
jgi:hypothetical protein